MPETPSDHRLDEPPVRTASPTGSPGFPGAVPSSAPPVRTPAPNHEEHPAPAEAPARPAPPAGPRHHRHGDSLITRGARAMWRTVYTDAFPNDWAHAVDICQRPVTTGRRIGVLSPTGGVGASTITAAMAALLANVRTDDVAAVDLCPAPSGLSARLPSTTAGSSLGALASSPEFTADDADLTHFGTLPQPRLRCLIHSTEDAGLHAWQVRSLHRSLSRRYAAAICELPRPAAAPEGLGSYGMHALVIALSPAPGDVEVNCQTLSRIRRADPAMPLLPVLVNSRRHPHTSRRQAAAWLRRGLRDLGLHEPLHHLDADRHLATGGALSIDRIGEARRLQIVQLTAASLLTASGES